MKGRHKMLLLLWLAAAGTCFAQVADIRTEPVVAGLPVFDLPHGVPVNLIVSDAGYLSHLQTNSIAAKVSVILEDGQELGDPLTRTVGGYSPAEFRKLKEWFIGKFLPAEGISSNRVVSLKIKFHDSLGHFLYASEGQDGSLGETLCEYLVVKVERASHIEVIGADLGKFTLANQGSISAEVYIHRSVLGVSASTNGLLTVFTEDGKVAAYDLQTGALRPTTISVSKDRGRFDAFSTMVSLVQVAGPPGVTLRLEASSDCKSWTRVSNEFQIGPNGSEVELGASTDGGQFFRLRRVLGMSP